MSGTTAGDFRIDLDEWRQLCADAVSQAKSGKNQEFANKMAASARQYGLRTYISAAQMRWLCEIADQIPPPLRHEEEVRARPAYVPRASAGKKHPCRWTGCTTQVPESMWGCMMHWRMVPGHLRKPLLKAFSEMGDSLSAEYIAAYDAIQQWLKERTT
jgi:hypothetical protein